MSPLAELAAKILQQIARGQIVPVADQMHLRYVAHSEERTLPLDEIARRILGREGGDAPKADAAAQG